MSFKNIKKNKLNFIKFKLKYKYNFIMIKSIVLRRLALFDYSQLNKFKYPKKLF